MAAWNVGKYFESERLELTWKYAYRTEFLPLLMTYLGARSGTRILEVGCGTAMLSRQLATTLPNTKVIGLDKDPDLLASGISLISKEKLSNRISLVEGDTYRIPFRDKTFDMTTSHTLFCVLDDPTRALREHMRVTKLGGVVSAVACYCRSGNLPRYHGRYPLPGNDRVNELDHKFQHAFRISIRPSLLSIDHSVLAPDLVSEFEKCGLQNVQANGHLVLVCPGDARIPIEEGSAYAVSWYEREISRLVTLQMKYSEELTHDGFSTCEMDELIDLKKARQNYIQKNPGSIRQIMEAFVRPLVIVKGTRG